MDRQVYIGAMEYAAGKPVTIERGNFARSTCERLRNSTHGSLQFPHHESDILELVAIAIDKALVSSQLDRTQLDAVFLVSNLLDARDNLDTRWLSHLNSHLNLVDVATYHVGITGCGGFHWALRLAAGLVASNDIQHALIVSFDKAGGQLNRVYGEDSTFLYVTGDAAACCIVSNTQSRMDFLLTGRIVNLYDGSQLLNPSMDNEIRIISRLFDETYKKSGVSATDIKHFITNNYSLDVSKLYCQLANINFKKAFTGTIATHAHCFSSDNIINLHYLTKRGDLQQGDRVLLFSTGPTQWGSCILEKVAPNAEAQH